MAQLLPSPDEVREVRCNSSADDRIWKARTDRISRHATPSVKEVPLPQAPGRCWEGSVSERGWALCRRLDEARRRGQPQRSRGGLRVSRMESGLGAFLCEAEEPTGSAVLHEELRDFYHRVRALWEIIGSGKKACQLSGCTPRDKLKSGTGA